MAVVVINIDQGRAMSIDDIDTLREHFNAAIMGLFGIIGISKKAFDSGLPTLAPIKVAYDISKDPTKWKLGRRNIQTVTSTWTRAKYPNARFEITVTMVSLINPDITHQFILYIK